MIWYILAGDYNLRFGAELSGVSENFQIKNLLLQLISSAYLYINHHLKVTFNLTKMTDSPRTTVSQHVFTVFESFPRKKFIHHTYISTLYNSQYHCASSSNFPILPPTHAYEFPYPLQKKKRKKKN